MNQKINYTTIILIIIVSSSIGLVYNYFNSKGIPLIRKEKQIEWTKDSLLYKNSDSSSDKVIVQKAELKKENKTPGFNNKEKVFKAVPSKPTYINLKQAYKLFESKTAVFIDARDKWDFSDGHIPNSINIPEYKFDNNDPVLKSIPKNKTLITYCGGDDCEMSSKLADNLFNLGYKNVYIFFGGWKEWLNAGYKFERDEL
jgi:rhodanese-related sulfurtransferase